MRFKGLDLNLLVAFDSLMEQRSVSAAARHMNLSQPAMSAALGRLRDYFHDELLISHGKRMHPTAYAESLLPIVRDSLHRIDELIAISATFDPGTSERTFRVIASDYIVVAIIAPLIRRIAGSAPGIRIETLLPGDSNTEYIAQGKADLVIKPDQYLSREQPAELLLEERHVVVGWRENPIFMRAVTEADVMGAGHVDVRVGDELTTVFASNHMEKSGRQRRVEVTTTSFTIVPWLLIDTLRLALMHERLALRMATMFPIAMVPIPFIFPVMREMMQFSHARAGDEGLLWLRAQMKVVAAED